MAGVLVTDADGGAMAGVCYGNQLAGLASCIRGHVVVDGVEIIEHEMFDVSEDGKGKSFGVHRTPLARYAKWITWQVPAPEVT